MIYFVSIVTKYQQLQIISIFLDFVKNKFEKKIRLVKSNKMIGFWFRIWYNEGGKKAEAFILFGEEC